MRIRREIGVASCVCLWLLGSLAGCVVELDVCQQDTECDARQRCSDGVCVDKPHVAVEANVGNDTTWTADRIWVLKGVITVMPSVTLTIEPGTTILGERQSALIVHSGARLVAIGTRAAPIVFTSAEPEGQRLPGDWAGVALLGRAPVNRTDAYLRIGPSEIDSSFGGSQPEWDCGALRYVRIEFAGGQIQGEEYLNSLSLCGCGTETQVDHVQLHFGGDDGLEIFGGTVDVRYMVITRAGDEAIDIDLGWVGTGQFIAIQSDAAGEGGIEADNLQEDASALPLTDFRLYNFTLIGPGASSAITGILMKYGAGGLFSHGIVMDFGGPAVNVSGAEAGARAIAGQFDVRDTLFYRIGTDGETWFPMDGDPDEGDGSDWDDAGYQEIELYTDPTRNNVFGEDPGLVGYDDLSNPGWIPTSDSITGVDPPPAPLDPTANYRGAFAPGSIPWTEGWTDYPES